MDITHFRKIEKRIFPASIVFSVICAVVFTVVRGIEPNFYAGIALGTVIMLCNLHLFGIAVKQYMGNAGMLIPVLLYILRLLMYGLGAVISFQAGITCLIAYALGVMGLVVGALLNLNKGGGTDQ